MPDVRTVARTDDTADWTAPQLVALLALTALPVILTSIVMTVPRFHGLAGLSPNVVSHAAYAASNWVTFTLIWAIAGPSALRAHGMRWRMTGRRIGVAFAGFAAGVAIYLAVTWLQRRTGVPTTAGMSFRRLSSLDVTVLAFSAALTAPFCEEVFFRVLWVGGLARRIPAAAAAACAILAFAAIHYPYFGSGGVVFISVWTLVPVALFLRTGDFTAPLLMHVLNNAWAYLIVPLLF